MGLLCHQGWVGSVRFQKHILVKETPPVDLLTMTKYINLAQHLTKERKKSIASSNAYYREFLTWTQCVLGWIDVYGMCEMTPEKVINQNYLKLLGLWRQRPTTRLDIRVALLHIIKGHINISLVRLWQDYIDDVWNVSLLLYRGTGGKHVKIRFWRCCKKFTLQRNVGIKSKVNFSFNPLATNKIHLDGQL